MNGADGAMWHSPRTRMIRTIVAVSIVNRVDRKRYRECRAYIRWTRTRHRRSCLVNVNVNLIVCIWTYQYTAKLPESQVSWLASAAFFRLTWERVKIGQFAGPVIQARLDLCGEISCLWVDTFSPVSYKFPVREHYERKENVDIHALFVLTVSVRFIGAKWA